MGSTKSLWHFISEKDVESESYQWNTKSLSGANSNIGSHLADWFEDGTGQEVSGRHNNSTVVMAIFGKFREVIGISECVGVLNDGATVLPVAEIGIRGCSNDSLNVEKFSSGLDDGNCLGMAVLREH